jgi:hypothetical protein
MIGSPSARMCAGVQRTAGGVKHAFVSALLEFASATPIFRSTHIPGFLITTAIRRPRLALAVALAVLAALAGTMTYAGFLVVGVLADYLGTGRFMAGLLLGAVFARFPWVRQGKLRIVGLLPKPARRPVIVSLLALCLMHFLSSGDHVPAAFTGFAGVFLLAYPWLRRAMFDRTLSSVFKFTGRNRPDNTDDRVIEGEFREKNDQGDVLR